MRGRLSRWGGSVLVAVGAALALFATPAQAMPGDPEIVNLAPPQFASTSLVKSGLDVTFSCPAYRTGDAGGLADGGTGDYGVRLAMANTSVDGRLPGPGEDGFYAEAPAQAIQGTPDCSARLPFPDKLGPPPLIFGGFDWQAARRCPGCNSGWEPGPVGWVILRPALEEPALTIPEHIYAGYLTRFGFATASDLGGATIGLQWFARTGWSDLERTQFVPGAESVFFAKLSAGHHLLRVNFFAEPLAVFSTPYEEVTVLKPGRHRATGPRDDGVYFVRRSQPLAGFEVVGEGRRIREIVASVPYTCASNPPPAGQSSPTVRIRIDSARIAPDGSVVARATYSRSSGSAPIQAILVGSLRQRHFVGTVTAAFGDCSGSRQIEVRPAPAHPFEPPRGTLR